MGGLISLGSRQDLFQSPSTATYLVPVTVGRFIGFCDEDEHEDLADTLGWLQLDGSSTSDSLANEEDAVLIGLSKNLAKQTKDLEAAAVRAAKFARSIGLAIDLQATTESGHNNTLVKSIAQFASDQYNLIDSAVAAVSATMSKLNSETGAMRNEEQTRRAIMHRPNTGVITDQIIAEAELLSYLAICFVLQFSGLVAQAKVLYRALEINDNETFEILMDPPYELSDCVENLRSELDAVLNLRE
ncbi:hypothetical protein ACHAPE_009234 [Trichoderma viride]